MVKVTIDEQDYLSVEEAREMLGVSPKEMAILLEAEALRSRKDPHDQTIRWVRVEDVKDAYQHLNRYRLEEKQRLSQLVSRSEKKSEHEPREISYYTFSDTYFTTLLMALVSYFDAERDIFFRWQDTRDDIHKTVNVVTKIYLRLEEGRKAGRSVTDIVEEIYDQQPSLKARNEVFQYLVKKAT